MYKLDKLIHSVSALKESQQVSEKLSKLEGYGYVMDVAAAQEDATEHTLNKPLTLLIPKHALIALP